jgi:outer membrane protein TolC
MSGRFTLNRQFIGVRSAALLGVAVALAAGPGCIHLHSAPTSAQLSSRAMPHVQVPAQWIAQGTSTEAVQSGWLAELKDPALEALAAEALTYNPDLQVAQARVEQSRILMEAAGGALQRRLPMPRTRANPWSRRLRARGSAPRN